jgi:hypothetical protein
LYAHFADPVYADIMYKEALREYKRQPQEQAPKGKFSFLSKLFTLIYSIIVLFNIKALMKKYLAQTV